MCAPTFRKITEMSSDMLRRIGKKYLRGEMLKEYRRGRRINEWDEEMRDSLSGVMPSLPSINTLYSLS